MMSAQGGGTPKADAVRKLSKGGCVKIQIGGGVKDTNVLQTSYVHGPLMGNTEKERRARKCNSANETTRAGGEEKQEQ